MNNVAYKAKELSNPKCQTWMKRSYHHPFIDRSQQNKKENDKFETMNAKEPSIINDETDNDSTTSIKSMVSQKNTTDVV